MDRLLERLEVAKKALTSLAELVEADPDDAVARDAAIQRFEYSFEAVWKAAQRYLKTVEGLETGSPRQAARASMQTGLLSEVETRSVLMMVDDRNLTVHTYNEGLARDIFGRLSRHLVLLEKWVDAVQQRFEQVE